MSNIWQHEQLNDHWAGVIRGRAAASSIIGEV